ncbi:MAG: hypothetical protein JO174_21285 [Herbaspirillum sp.]|nr:hypothetical protein [Herbaspirillum sp.]
MPQWHEQKSNSVWRKVFSLTFARLLATGIIAKIGQFLEGFTTKILTDEFGRPEMQDWLGHQTQNQRIKLARTLGIILGKHCRLFEKVSHIRNAYLHDLQNTGLTLVDYFAVDEKHAVSIANGRL